MVRKSFHAQEMQLHITKAQLFTEQSDLEQAVQALKAAYKLTNHKSCEPIK